MNNRRTTLAFYAVIIILAVALIAANWVNFLVTENTPAGEYFSVYWLSTRAFLKDGTSPYSPETSAQIRDFANEHGYPADPSLHQFTSPIYQQIFILPFAFISDFAAANVAWMSTLEIALLLSVWFGVSLSGWRPTAALLIVIALFFLLNFLSISQILSGSIIILVLLMIVLSFVAIRRGLDELAGILLALSTVQPYVVAPLIIFVLLWGITARRGRLVVWLLGSLLLLVVSGILFLRDWPIQFLNTITNFPTAHYFENPQKVFLDAFPGLGSQLGWVLTGMVALILLLEWWLAHGKDFRWFFWTVCITIAFTPWLGVPTETGHLVMLTLPLLLVFSKLEERWGMNFRPVLFVFLLIAFLGLWLPFAWGFPSSIVIRLYPALFAALPLVVILGLYWIRWWAIRPRRTFISELRARDEF